MSYIYFDINSQEGSQKRSNLGFVSHGAENELYEDEGNASPDVSLVVSETIGVDERLQPTE